MQIMLKTVVERTRVTMAMLLKSLSTKPETTVKMSLILVNRELLLYRLL